MLWPLLRVGGSEDIILVEGLGRCVVAGFPLVGVGQWYGVLKEVWLGSIWMLGRSWFGRRFVTYMVLGTEYGFGNA